MRSARRPLAALAAALALSGAPPAGSVQPNFKVYDDEFAFAPQQRLTAGLRLDVVPLASLTTTGAPDATALEAQSTWDFTPAGSLPGATDTIAQAVPVNASWTCYLPDTIGCGFGAADVTVLLVGDTVVEGRASRDVSAGSYDPATGIFKGRATIQDEGNAAEVRLCLGTAADAPVVPVAVFPNVEQGTNRRFMRASDPQWQSPVFDCFDAATLGAPCKAPGGQSASLDAESGQTEGRIRNRFVRAGTITLPSGHVIDSLLVESFTSYTAKAALIAPCALPVLTYRQWRLAWVVPHHGILASLSSPEDTPTLAGFVAAKSTFLGYGLLPPVSIQVTDSTQSSVTVSWNPGLLGERLLDGYEVHWGPVSGKQQAPSFHSGVIPKGTTSYTITGLTAGQTIHVSVTSRRSYVDPHSGIVTQYESIELPKFMGADTNGDGTLDTSYPPEVAATTLLPGACVAGDISPDGAGDGAVTLADFVIGRRKVLGTVARNSRDTTCGDVHPGAYACQPEGQPARWCTTPNALFQTGDVVNIRRKVSRLLTFACSGCPQVAAPPLPDELRLPGDVAPRGAADGDVTINDVVLTLRLATGLETGTAEELLRADVAPADRSSGQAEPIGDGLVNVADVVLLLRESVGLDQMRWPVRKIRARLTDAVDLIGFVASLTGWPAWATADPAFTPLVSNCDETTLTAQSGEWTAVCLTDPVVHQGPTDLFEVNYRGIEDVDPATLAASPWPFTYVTRPDLTEPAITLELSVP